MLRHGRGVDKDEARAIALYRMACEFGEADTCHAAGLAYETGSGVPVNGDEAARLFRRACQLGHRISCGRTGPPE